LPSLQHRCSLVEDLYAFGVEVPSKPLEQREGTFFGGRKRQSEEEFAGIPAHRHTGSRVVEIGFLGAQATPARRAVEIEEE